MSIGLLILHNRRTQNVAVIGSTQEPVEPTPRNLDEDLLIAMSALPQGIYVRRADGSYWKNFATDNVAESRHVEVLVGEMVERLLGSVRAGTSVAETMTLAGPPSRSLVVQAHGLDNGVGLATVEDVTERVRLDAVRTDFVANISHELKTPVGALSILAETLTDESDPAIVARLAEKMVAEASRAATTIDDLLELSRIELGGGAITDPVDLSTIATEAAERVRSSAEQHQVVVINTSPAEGVVISGDRRQLMSAVANLLENAIKYSEPGQSVEVAVSTEAGVALLCVRDHGVGIPVNDLDRIFERFYRVDRARSRDTGGTGLGLAIVRHVATNHGGEVTVTSTEGEGSTFCLRLPLRQPNN